MKATENNEDSVTHLLGVFLRIVPDMMFSLEANLREGRHAAISQYAHALKSSLALVGAVQCSEEMEELERLARRNEASSDAAYIEHLRQELTAVLEEVRCCLQLRRPDFPSDGPL